MAEVTDNVSQSNIPTQTDSITPSAPDTSVPNLGDSGASQGVPAALAPTPQAPQDAPPVAPAPPSNLQADPGAPAPAKSGDDEDGVDKMKRLKDLGATDQQIAQWKSDTQNTLTNKGATPEQIKQYFREGEPDTSAMQAFTKGNMASYTGDPAKDALKPGAGFEEQLKHALGGFISDVGIGMQTGFQQSATGMYARGSVPTMQLGPDADWTARTAAGVSSLLGDAPVMIPSAIAATLAGGPVAGGAAAFGVPAAVRKMLVDHYQRGDITTASEFAHRLVGTAWEATKGAAVGAATSFLGPVGGKLGGELTGSLVGSSVGRLGTELATMTTVSKGLEGRLPNAQDFIDGASVLALLHGATGATSPLSPELGTAQERVATAAMPLVTKLHNIFATTGEHPADIVTAAQSDEVLKQKLLSNNPQEPAQITKQPTTETPDFNEEGKLIAPEDNTVLDNVKVDPEHPAVKNFSQVDGSDDNATKTTSIAVPTEDDSVIPPRAKLDGFNIGFRQKLVNQLDPIKNFTDQLTGGNKQSMNLPAGDNPYTQAVLMKNVAAKVVGSLSHYTTDYSGNETGESYDAVVKDFPKAKQSEPLSDSENKVLEAFEPDSIKDMSNTGKRANAYMVARRVVNDLQTRVGDDGAPVETGVDLEAAKDVFNSLKSDYEPVAKRMTAYGNRILDLHTEAGLSSGESNAAMRSENPMHTPLFRDQGEDQASGVGTGGKGYQRLTGSDKLIFPPLESIQENTAEVIKRVEANRVAQTMEKLNNSVPIEQRVLAPEPGSVRKVTLSAKQLEKGGIDADAIPDGGVSALVGDYQPLKSNQIQVFNDGVRKVYTTDPQLAEAVQGLSQSPAQIGILGKILMAPMRITAAGLRAGTVLNPGFMLRHFERSQMLSQVQGDYAQAPIIDAARALGPLISENGDFEKWYAAGGAVDAQGKLADYLKSSPWDDSSEPNSIWDKSKTSGGFISKALNTIKNPAQMTSLGAAMRDSFSQTEQDTVEQIAKIQQELGASGGLNLNPIKTIADALGYVSELSDSSTRLAQFQRQGGTDLETGINPNDVTDYDKRSRAALAASNITLNYNLKGQWIQSYSAITPFMNVGIQGMDRMVQAFKDNPVSMTAKSLGMITGPSVALYAVNHNQSWYKQLPDWQKDLYWHYMIDKWEPANGPDDLGARSDDMRRQMPDGSWQVNNGTVYKVPKPFELGVLFGSLPERAMGAYFDDRPHAFSGLANTLGQAVPNAIPSFATPFMEQAFNHVMFTGNPLINDSNQKLTADLQYNDFTSESARQIGGELGKMGGDNVGPQNVSIASPAVVDNYIRSWTGQLGAQVVQQIDTSLRQQGIVPNVPKASSPQDNPFVAAYTERFPQARQQNIEDFQSDYKQAIIAQNSLKKKMEMAAQMSAMGQNDPNAQKFYEEALASANAAAQAAQMEPKLTAVSKTLSNLNLVLHGIRISPDMSADDKSRATDLAYRQMSQVADKGNAMMAQFQKVLKLKQQQENK